MRTFRRYFVLLVIPLILFIVLTANRVFINKINFGTVDIRQLRHFFDEKGTNVSSHRETDGFCSSKSEVFWQEGFVDDDNNTAWPWNLTARWQCPDYHYNQYTLYRRKSTLDCSTGSPRFITTMTNSPSDIQIVEPGDACLLSYIKNCCHDNDSLVPNVMNYIWYSDVEVGFFTMISFISVIRYMRPCLVLFHGPYVPKGTFWNFFISVYPNVILVNESPITNIFGQWLKHKEHGSDVMRILALRDYGGLYLDWDQVLIKPIDPLRNYSFTMSLEKAGHLGNQFILAQQNATFLHHYYMGYKNYTGAWAFNSILYPHILSQKYPELINVLEYTGLKPKQKGGKELWRGNSDWSESYALHLYLRGFKEKWRLNMKTIRYENTTIGAVSRRVLFGNKEMCTKTP